MIETTQIVYCLERGIMWGARSEAPDCADPSHLHVESEIHRHREQVVLPDGTAIVAVSFDPNDPYTRIAPPDFGLYLEPCWSPPWAHDFVDWPDFGLPASSTELRTKLTDLLARSRSGERVEMGCLGSHGRTGTALACLAVLTGMPASDAVGWVRQAHCDKAVETPEQSAYVEDFAGERDQG